MIDDVNFSRIVVFFEINELDSSDVGKKRIAAMLLDVFRIDSSNSEKFSINIIGKRPSYKFGLLLVYSWKLEKFKFNAKFFLICSVVLSSTQSS